MWSKDILKVGTYWKIENGESINTQKDAWNPDLSSGKITSNPSFDNNTNVGSLILPTKNWEINKITTLFLPFETEAI